MNSIPIYLDWTPWADMSFRSALIISDALVFEWKHTCTVGYFARNSVAFISCRKRILFLFHICAVKKYTLVYLNRLNFLITNHFFENRPWLSGISPFKAWWKQSASRIRCAENKLARSIQIAQMLTLLLSLIWVWKYLMLSITRPCLFSCYHSISITYENSYLTYGISSICFC